MSNTRKHYNIDAPYLVFCLFLATFACQKHAVCSEVNSRRRQLRQGRPKTVRSRLRENRGGVAVFAQVQQSLAVQIVARRVDGFGNATRGGFRGRQAQTLLGAPLGRVLEATLREDQRRVFQLRCDFGRIPRDVFLHE